LSAYARKTSPPPPLLTVEGELDDISGSGQTEAAHKLCTNITRHDSHHLEVKGAGHYGIFSGRRWREVVYPHVCEFILRHPHGAMAAPSGAKRRGTAARKTSDGHQAPHDSSHLSQAGNKPESSLSLEQDLLNALPQTQCTRCGYPDCAGYARAIVQGEARINQCPPGGQAGIERLAALTGQPALPLNAEHGVEAPRTVVWIDENWCIGCTLCIEACPTDAIVGTHKRMHTVIEPYCTGCELCLPVCPVDCILVENASGDDTGWKAWSGEQADLARSRYAQRQQRLVRAQAEHQSQQAAKARNKLAHLNELTHTDPQDQAGIDRKRAIIEAALARAKARLG